MEERRYRLQLLGPFELQALDGARVHVPSRKGMALVAMLALSRSGQRSRAWLQDRLWGNRDREQASASLRREVHNLRTCLELPSGDSLLTGDAHHVRLNLSRVDVDVRQLDEDLAAGRSLPVLGYGELLEGLDLYAEEGFEDWLREQRLLTDNLVEQARNLAWRRHALANERIDPPLTTAQVMGGDMPMPIKPSICVRPFQAVSGPDGFAAALSEHIATSLSGWSTLMVVTAGADLARTADRAMLCRVLGVRYLLEGSVQQERRSLRVAVHLIDGVVGEQLWSATFDDLITNAFALQDRIADTVAPLIDSSVEKCERRRLSSAPVTSAGAHDLYWRANSLMRLWEPDSTAEAIRMAEQVLDMEPTNGWASSLAAFGYAAQLVQGWSSDPDTARRKGLAHFDQAMRIGSDDPYVLGNAAGALIGIGGDLAKAEALLDRALDLNPNMPATLFWAGWVDTATGRLNRAIERFLKALRLNPQMAVRPYVLTGLALALLGSGRASEARPLLAEASAQAPQFAPTQMATVCCAVLLGSMADAREAASRLEACGGLEAAFRILRDPGQQAAVRALVSSVGQSAAAAELIDQAPVA